MICGLLCWRAFADGVSSSSVTPWPTRFPQDPVSHNRLGLVVLFLLMGNQMVAKVGDEWN